MTELQPWLFEAVVAGGAVLLAVAELVPVLREKAGEITLVLVAGAAAAAVLTMHDDPVLLAGGLLAADPVASFFKLVLAMIALATVWVSTRAREAELGRSGLSWAAFLASLLGFDLMTNAMHAGAAWAGFELASVAAAAWIWTRYRLDPSMVAGRAAALEEPSPPAPAGDSAFALERAVLLQGLAASAVLLFGFALVSALTGTLDYAQLAGRLSLAIPAPGGRAVLTTAIVLVLVAIGSRIAMVPWHTLRAWVAEAAPLPAAVWLQVGATVAGVGMLARFLGVALVPQGSIEASNLAFTPWPELLAIAAVLTMTIANVAALRAHDVKRLFGWLAVAQGGYLVLCLSLLVERGLGATLVHTVAFAIATIGALAAVSLVTDAAGSSDFEVIRGLARRRGALVVSIAIFVFSLSLAGVPPSAGHAARARLVTALVRGDELPMVAAAALTSLVGLICLVRVLATMLDRPADPEEPVEADSEAVSLLLLLVAATVWLGVWPGPLVGFAARSVVFFGG